MFVNIIKTHIDNMQNFDTCLNMQEI